MITFDIDELTDFRKITKDIDKKFQKDSKKLINSAGMAFKQIAKGEYMSKTGKKTGLLRKSLTKAKAYKWHGRWQVRVKNKAPHAHLLEYGHRMVDWHTGKVSQKTPYVKGRFPMDAAAAAFAEPFNKMCEDFIDEFIENLGEGKE